MNQRTEPPVAWPPEPRPPHPDWGAFEQALVSTLSVMKDEFLILSVKATGRYVQLHVSPADGVHAEAVSNDYLPENDRLTAEQVTALGDLGWTMPTPAPDGSGPKAVSNFVRTFPSPFSCAEVARLVVRTLAEIHHATGPDALEYKAFDEPGTTVYLPALRLNLVQESPTRPRPRRTRRPVGPFDRLKRELLRAARQATGLGSLEYDENGWINLPIGNRMGFARASATPTYVRVHLHLRAGLEADEELLARLHAVNGNLPLVRVVVLEGIVDLGVDFPAEPFVPAHLQQAMSALARMADDVEKDLFGPQAPAEAPATN